MSLRVRKSIFNISNIHLYILLGILKVYLFECTRWRKARGSHNDRIAKTLSPGDFWRLIDTSVTLCRSVQSLPVCIHANYFTHTNEEAQSFRYLVLSVALSLHRNPLCAWLPLSILLSPVLCALIVLVTIEQNDPAQHVRDSNPLAHSVSHPTSLTLIVLLFYFLLYPSQYILYFLQLLSSSSPASYNYRYHNTSSMLLYQSLSPLESDSSAQATLGIMGIPAGIRERPVGNIQIEINTQTNRMPTLFCWME